MKFVVASLAEKSGHFLKQWTWGGGGSNGLEKNLFVKYSLANQVLT